MQNRDQEINVNQIISTAKTNGNVFVLEIKFTGIHRLVLPDFYAAYLYQRISFESLYFSWETYLSGLSQPSPLSLRQWHKHHDAPVVSVFIGKLRRKGQGFQRKRSRVSYSSLSGGECFVCFISF